MTSLIDVVIQIKLKTYSAPLSSGEGARVRRTTLRFHSGFAAKSFHREMASAGWRWNLYWLVIIIKLFRTRILDSQFLLQNCYSPQRYAKDTKRAAKAHLVKNKEGHSALALFSMELLFTAEVREGHAKGRKGITCEK